VYAHRVDRDYYTMITYYYVPVYK